MNSLYVEMSIGILTLHQEGMHVWLKLREEKRGRIKSYKNKKKIDNEMNRIESKFYNQYVNSNSYTTPRGIEYTSETVSWSNNSSKHCLCKPGRNSH